MPGDNLRVEATGETVGEAKWAALRELERQAPGLDRASVQFEVLSEGERGLLGVGYLPARVAASVEAGLRPAERSDEGEAAAAVRELIERTADAAGVGCWVELREDAEVIEATLAGDELGVLIGRHGQTLDALQVLANAIVSRRSPETRKAVVVDAEGYRRRREAALSRIAADAAERALAHGRAVELEPMSAAERKIVHTRLAEDPRVETSSDGSEPHRYVVVRPAAGTSPLEPSGDGTTGLDE